MHLLYIDESGDPNGWENQKVFVLGAVAVHEGQVATIAKSLEAIQLECFPGVNIPIPFHAVDIYGGKGRFDNVAKDARIKILTNIYHMIAGIPFPNLVAFATAIDETSLRHPSETIDKTFSDLSSRFNIFLTRQHRQGLPTKGLMIIDQAHQDEYRKLLSQFQSEGTPYGQLLNVIDIPYFAGRQQTRMLQMADMVAYAVFRYYERNDDIFLKLILEKFDRKSATHEPDGLKHIIAKSKNCLCLACKWRMPATDRYKLQSRKWDH